MDINEKAIQKKVVHGRDSNAAMWMSSAVKPLEENNHLLDVLHARTILLPR